MDISSVFNEVHALHQLKHYLPAQAPLKDFVHHNTLHAFQDMDFYDALRKSAIIFGNRTTLSILEYKKRYADGDISEKIIDAVIQLNKPASEFQKWKDLLFNMEDPESLDPKIGRLRKHWELDYKIDMDGMVRPNFIRIINAYLDQGIAFEGFPESSTGLLDAVLAIQNNSYVKLFSSKRAITLLAKKDKKLADLLTLIVGDERYYEQYLLDQQYAHPGLSGMVCAIETKPDAIYSQRPATLFDIIYLELLFELEALENFVNLNFKPLAIGADFEPENIFSDVPNDDYWKVLELWQEAFETMYHDQVLVGLTADQTNPSEEKITSQAFFCIDDREESIRRNIEMIAPECQTFGTPAHFNIVARFKPEDAKFSTQICPAPFTPTHLIKETNRKNRPKKDVHFQTSSHQFLAGFVISQTIGFLSSIKLFTHIFNPKESVAQYNATKDHMDYDSSLVYESKGKKEDGYQVGFTIEEMIDIVATELSNTGLTTNFAPLIYHFGHGGSSTNNPYFAGYNCGACSGRPSTVNARLFAIMANRKEVRKGVKVKGITIPETTHFVGGYHDTTRDTFAYFDEQVIPSHLNELHQQNKIKFSLALNNNAKERARQFKLINIKKSAKKIHNDVLKRSLSLFEPRPEYNHSNNALFIVGNRNLTKNLFLDQRAFLNSYDYKKDKDGHFLENILNAGTGVCGGINLEYYFSSVDNEKLGAGSKLPQNVIGLYGVANGVKGDLRPGLPWQMIDVHDPVRILTVVENTPAFVLSVLEKNPTTFDWYRKGWMKLTVFDPYTQKITILKDGGFVPYQAISEKTEKISDFEKLFESTHKNLPVYQIN